MAPPKKKPQLPTFDPYGIPATNAALDEARGKFVRDETRLALILLAVAFFLVFHTFRFGPPPVASEIQIKLDNASHNSQKQPEDPTAMPGSETSDVDYLPRIGTQPVLMINIANDVDTVKIADVVSSEHRPTMVDNAPPEPMKGSNPGCFDLTTDKDTPNGMAYTTARDLEPSQYTLNEHDPKNQTDEPFISVKAKTLTTPRDGFLRTLICTISARPTNETDTAREIRFRNLGQLNFRSNLIDENVSNVAIIGDDVTSESASAALVPNRRNAVYFWTDEEAARWREYAILGLGIILGLLPAIALDIRRFQIDMKAKKNTDSS